MTDEWKQSSAAESAAAAKAAAVLPALRQVNWNCMEFYGFVHFGLYTFDPEHEFQTGPEIFDPVDFDAGQWVRAMKSAGMKGLLLTCKHHEGFCLWPSKYTDFSVKASPWKDGKGDIVKEVSEACRREGLKFGVYLSPWDVHEKTYGMPEYNDYFCGQLEELCTGYGELFCVWFDGANRNPQKEQPYDWDRYYATIRRYQPDACISICGPDVRWIGNEAGVSREEEWSVVPREIMTTERNPGYWRLIDTIPNSTWTDIGSRSFIRDYEELIWYPAEVDVSIRPSWGYMEGEDTKLHSLGTLMNMYEKAVGGNANLLLNIPPNRRGLFDEADVNRLKEMGAAIRKMFSRPQTEQAVLTTGSGKDASCLLSEDRSHFISLGNEEESACVDIRLPQKRRINLLTVKETIEKGQKIEAFRLEAAIEGEADMRTLYEASTIGYQRIGRFEPVETDHLRLTVLRTRGEIFLTQICLYEDEQRISQ